MIITLITRVYLFCNAQQKLLSLFHYILLSSDLASTIAGNYLAHLTARIVQVNTPVGVHAVLMHSAILVKPAVLVFNIAPTISISNGWDLCTVCDHTVLNAAIRYPCIAVVNNGGYCWRTGGAQAAILSVGRLGVELCLGGGLHELELVRLAAGAATTPPCG